MGFRYSDRIAIALDVDSTAKARDIASDLKGRGDHILKVGKVLHTAEGGWAISLVKEMNARLFLDLKLHDTPDTVAKTMEVITRMDVALTTVHAAGGPKMMEAAREAALKASRECGYPIPTILAVTMLSSMVADVAKTVGFDMRGVDMNDTFAQQAAMLELAVKLAKLAQSCGVDGCICSGLEVEAIRKACGKGFYIVAVGTRSTGIPANDQRRVETPTKAIMAGADLIVAGRQVVMPHMGTRLQAYLNLCSEVDAAYAAIE